MVVDVTVLNAVGSSVVVSIVVGCDVGSFDSSSSTVGVGSLVGVPFSIVGAAVGSSSIATVVTIVGRSDGGRVAGARVVGARVVGSATGAVEFTTRNDVGATVGERITIGNVSLAVGSDVATNGVVGLLVSASVEDIVGSDVGWDADVGSLVKYVGAVVSAVNGVGAGVTIVTAMGAGVSSTCCNSIVSEELSPKAELLESNPFHVPVDTATIVPVPVTVDWDAVPPVTTPTKTLSKRKKGSSKKSGNSRTSSRIENIEKRFEIRC
jgi:hypothetical protein